MCNTELLASHYVDKWQTSSLRKKYVKTGQVLYFHGFEIIDGDLQTNFLHSFIFFIFEYIFDDLTYGSHLLSLLILMSCISAFSFALATCMSIVNRIGRWDHCVYHGLTQWHITLVCETVPFNPLITQTLFPVYLCPCLNWLICTMFTHSSSSVLWLYARVQKCFICMCQDQCLYHIKALFITFTSVSEF